MEIGETIEPRSQAEFAEWLAANGQAQKEIWVVIAKKASGRQTVTYAQLVETALCYGWIDGLMKGIDAATYAQRFSPRRKRSSWTDANRAIARRLIDEGRMTGAGRAVLPEDFYPVLSAKRQSLRNADASTRKTTMKTHAIVIPEPNRIELREVQLVEPGADDVTIETVYTSISAGTERMLLAGRLPHPMLSFPIVPGYETVGRVVARGANVPAELEGRWVYLGGARCFEGVNPAWGGQAAALIADHRRVVPLDGVEPREGVLLALAATALHGVDLLATGAMVNPLVQPGWRTLVLGQGPVGQIAARLLRRAGAWVAVTDREASRLERSSADQIEFAGDTPLKAALGDPVDAIVEASGSMAALAEALPLLAEGGTVLLLGYYDELRLPYMPLFLKQARLLTAREWAPGDLARCRDMIADGSLDVRGLLTHHLPVEQVSEAYHTALHDPACLKLVLEWSSEF